MTETGASEPKQELQVRLRQQALLAELGRRALSGVDFEGLLEEAARLSALGLETRYAKVLEYLPELNRLLVRAGVGWEPGVVGHATLGAELDSPAGYALHTGKPVISNHLSEESRFRTPELLAQHGVQRAVNVILLGEGKPFGVLEVDGQQPGAFSEHDVDFLQGMANLLGVALERRQAEQALRQLNETLERRVASAVEERRQTEDALRQAQKMEAVGQLTGGVAHDFNNLLLVIGGNLELLARAVADNPNLARLVATAQKGVTRGAQLTSQLLAYARRQTLRPESRAINDMVRELDVLAARILGDAVEVELALNPEAGACMVDPAQFGSALLNLVVNSRDAMPEGGRLAIRTGYVAIDHSDAARHPYAQVGTYVTVDVADTGTGMTPDVLERATEPFFTTKGLGKGTGLGLSQVYGLLRQSGGFLTIDSSRGVGTTVRMHLPRVAHEPAQPVAAPSVERGSGTILVVEDDADVRELVVIQLADLGYDTLAAANGPEALELLAAPETPSVSLLLTDMVMPGGMSGIDLVRAAQARRPSLRAVLTSGFMASNASSTPGAAGMEGSGIKLLPKPYSQAKLARVIHEALDPAATPPPLAEEGRAEGA